MKSPVLLLIAALLSLSSANAAKLDLKKDFESLGGNEEIAERAKHLDPQNKVRVVQNRVVDRNMRIELGANFGLVSGGSSYLNTQNLGGNLDFHLTPKWSIGMRYYKSFNSLTNEGKETYDRAAADTAGAYIYPQIDYPEETALVVLNWYPIYGKTNLFDLGVSHFDIYTLIGYGKTKMSSGNSDTLAAGGGMGMWITQHLAARLEIRYQAMDERVYTGTRRIGTAVFGASLGILL